MDLVKGKKFLAASGLNLFAVLAVDALPAFCRESLHDLHLDLQKYSSLVLMASAGSQFWDQLQQEGVNSGHPFDERSKVLAQQFVRNYLSDVSAELIYPSLLPVPLIELGNQAGWSFPSPLGLGIHSDYGTWFAFRAVLLIAAELPATKSVADTESPCLACVDKPCVRQCPASAVDAQGAFKVKSCITYRQQDNSRCQDRCLARMACPIGREFQYRMPQMHYHAGRSLQSIRKYGLKLSENEQC